MWVYITMELKSSQFDFDLGLNKWGGEGLGVGSNPHGSWSCPLVGYLQERGW